MGTNYIAPTWRMPENTNKDKLSNYSIDFDGSSEYIDTGDAFTSLTSFSISAWFKSDDTTTAAQAIVSSRINSIGTSKGVDIYLGSNTLVARIYNNGATEVTTAFTDTSNWHQVVITYNGTTLELFLDNFSQGTATGVYINSAANWLIGKWNNDANYFDGSISEVAVFDYALSTDQIGYLYNLNNPMAISGAEPVAYWPLGDNSNPTALAGYPNISVGADSVFQIPGGNTLPNTITFGTKNSEELKITNKITISIWIKTTDNNVSSYTIEPFLTRNQYSEGWLIGKRWETSTSDGFLRMWFYNADGTNNVLDADGNWDDIANGKWHHIAYTYDGTSNAGGLKVYVDGQPSNSMATASTGIKDSTGSNWDTLILGMRQYMYETIDGEYSNLSIFNTDLPATGTQSIESLYANGTPPEISNYNNLVGWWKLNQTANWEADSTGNWQIPDATSSFPQSFNFIASQSDAINFGPANGLGFDSQISISAWFNQTPGGGNLQQLVAEDKTGSERNWGIILVGRVPNFQFFDEAGVQVQLVGTALPEGDWHHILCTATGDTSTNGVKMYINGQVVAQGTASNENIKNDNIQAKIGTQTASTSTYYFDGKISNVAVWNTDQSSEKDNIYNSGTPATSYTNMPQYWYKLDNTSIWNPAPANYWSFPNAGTITNYGIFNFSN